MRAFVRHAMRPEAAALAEVPVPEPGYGDVLVRVATVGLCGTDLHIFYGDQGYETVPAPMVMGHEFAGTIAGVGAGVDPARIGENVVAIVLNGCGSCALCRAGAENVCPDRRVPGVLFDGGLAEYCVLPSTGVRRLPDNLPPATAALVEPLSVAIHAARRAITGRTPGRALVTGPGPIGLLSALTLQRLGWAVELVGTEGDRAQRIPAAQKMGIDAYAHGDRDPDRHDVVIEASGAGQAMQVALDVVAPLGAISVVGIPSGRLELGISDALRREVSVHFSLGSVATDYREAIDWLTDEAPDLAPMLDSYPLEDTANAIRRARTGDTIKPVICIQTSTS
jgi:L-iditol 2-dehydrogenase